ncbi:hypothetical protein EVAR_95733_1 [Eumeta japonica]|uniref:Uncharacterized protein n=1 Tax=Eumeta variegata TaxID=151549 RepID=A0A4C1ULH2_EUMVA|nr:hypothetical protein EVAR_95733_1 [Eumeta japonica]
MKSRDLDHKISSLDPRNAPARAARARDVTRAARERPARLPARAAPPKKRAFDILYFLYTDMTRPAKLRAARGRPIIVEWERRKAFGGPLSFGDSS